MTVLCKFSLFLILAPALLWASQAQNYGLGGSTSGRAGSVAAEIENPFAAIFNPAVIAAQEKSMVSVSTSFAEVDYAPLQNIKTRGTNGKTSKASSSGTIELPNSHVALWALGYTLPFQLKFLADRRFGLGFVASGPYYKLRSYSASTPDDFFPFRYGTSDIQFKGTWSMAGEIWPNHLYLGLGLSMYISAAGSTDLAVVSNNPTGRMALDVELNTAFVAGLFARYDKNQLGLVFRQAVDPTLQQQITGRVQLDHHDILSQPTRVQSSLYHEPQEVEVEVQHDFRFLKASAGVSYQFWSSHKLPFLLVEPTDFHDKTHRTIVQQLVTRNIWSPRLSIEVPTFDKRLLISAGYQFRPTPVADLSGASNPLDSDIHVIGLSFRHRLTSWTWLPFPVSWGLYGQHHWFIDRHVLKTDPNSVGWPGYKFSGSVYNYGIFLQADI